MTGAPGDRDERCRRYERFRRIDAAFKTGDLDALQALATDDDRFPDAFADLAIGACLPYAVRHSPPSFVRRLVEAGADPNIDPGDGFPPLIAALSSATTAPGHAPRQDVHEILTLLLELGADPNQRGLNDYTALHWAAAAGDRRAIEILLGAGADASLRTRIDDCETPDDVAFRAGHAEAARRLQIASGRAG